MKKPQKPISKGLQKAQEGLAIDGLVLRGILPRSPKTIATPPPPPPKKPK
ncbi:hypothetical protein [Acidithiobacillus marinus]|jgi:hypothetical protein|nr:hypothetical protein [Acidithiobacillus marinus]